jgi:hypothetical protein
MTAHEIVPDRNERTCTVCGLEIVYRAASRKWTSGGGVDRAAHWAHRQPSRRHHIAAGYER